MCGIAGTIFNQNFTLGSEVLLLDIKKIIENEQLKSEELLELAWKYKSNINFLRFCKNLSEREELSNICTSLELFITKKRLVISSIDKSTSLSPYKQAVKECEQMMDAHWFLSEEIHRWVKTIEDLSNSNISEIDDYKIIFYKDLCKVIHAIDNRLELRGRDSLGLSIVINSLDSDDCFVAQPQIDAQQESYHSFDNINYRTHTFTFKVCNSIGGLGDNASQIRSLIKNNLLFNKLLNDSDIKSATIMAHTRWASVGAVNINNAHPISLVSSSTDKKYQSLALLNGDIYNYKDIINKAKKINEEKINSLDCTNDGLAIPAYLINESSPDLNVISKMASEFSGSFVISLQHTSNSESITLLKKGIQGLYLGFSYDGMMFSSDVYGLVETCKYFIPVESDTAMDISANNFSTANQINLKIIDHKSGNTRSIDSNDLQVTNITTRDIDKRGFKHFLEKEIYETSDIVERTMNGYLQPEKLIKESGLISAISMNNSQVPEFIITSLKNRKIKKIIITGMGTCYTAAVAMSMYMRSRLKKFIADIVVEPHIASEGSAFYLEPNMQDTLVIVIAQSGTTVDTNVYVQKAKQRGAMSLAIANKREGDVTFIGDGTIYIGEGRDIEIAVPSTKTYTAQVILGYILTLYFSINLAENENQKNMLISDLSNLRKSNKIIEDSFKIIKNKVSFSKINKFGCIHNSWYVLRDASSNGVCADELRIKYSENCYQSVSSLSISDIRNMNLNNSFITIISESCLLDLSDDILKLTAEGNSIALILIDQVIPKEIQELEDEDKVSIINMPAANKYFTFLPTVIAGQFLSYYLAIALDERKKYFVDIKKSLLSKKELKVAWNELENYLDKGYLNQGISSLDIRKLGRLIKEYIDDGISNNKSSLNQATSHLEYLIQLTRRTIDTIKHQAKTITVGAVRENMHDQSSLVRSEFNSNSSMQLNSDGHLIEDIYSCFNDKYIERLNISNYKEILIAFEEVDESYAYNIVNFINDFATQLDLNKKIRLAHEYDYPDDNNKSSACWIYISNSKVDAQDSFLSFLKEDQFINFDFKSFKIKKENILNYNKESSEEYKKSLWSLFLSIYISSKLLVKNTLMLDEDNHLSKRVKFEMHKQLLSLIDATSYINNSSVINSSIDYASKMFLTRKNWKCIGSGTNYNLSKFTSKRLIKKMRRACAFDVLENHKHIDMSAESAIIVFISNIWQQGYQEDAFSEIEKLISHNSLPIIVTNHEDDRYDNFSLTVEDDLINLVNTPVPIIKLPKVGQQYSFVANILFIEKLIDKMYTLIDSGQSMIQNRVAIEPPTKGMLVEYIWK